MHAGSVAESLLLRIGFVPPVIVFFMPSSESKWIPARVFGGFVRESIGIWMAMPHSLRRGTKPSVGDIADSEGFAVRVR